MIELRILERKVKRPRGIDDGMFHPSLPEFIYVDVPQYRRGYYRRDTLPFDDVTSYDAPFTGATWHGTDWTDVPRVREE